MSTQHVFYSGTGTTPAGGGLPDVGRFLVVDHDGALRFFQFDGKGDEDPTGALNFPGPNQGNQIGNGFGHIQHILGGGDGIILTIDESGDLRYFRYTGDGALDPSGTLGFDGPFQGTQIGNGFLNLLHVFVSPRAGATMATTIFTVDTSGDLRYYRYSGSGEPDPTGTSGFDGQNQGNQIGRGFSNMREIVGLGGGAFVTIDNTGDLRWFRYSGNGEQDPSGTSGFVGNNSGNQIGRGFQAVRHLFGGLTDDGGPARLMFAISDDGALRYFRYEGDGEEDPTGSAGFNPPNQGTQIGNGF